MQQSAMREYLMKYSDNPEWHKRVTRMNDDQVVAIYFRMINNPKKRTK